MESLSLLSYIFVLMTAIVAAPASVISYSYDLTGSPIVDDCTGQVATVTSGTEHVVIIENCSVKDTVTQCSFEFHFNVENVKIVWPDGTVGTFAFNENDHGTFTYDASTGTSSTTEHYLTHTGTISRGSAPNEEFLFKQECTFSFGPGGFNIDCSSPTVNLKCIS